MVDLNFHERVKMMNTWEPCVIKPQPAVAFSSKTAMTPLLVTVIEHKAQTQGFLSYWVSWKITPHLATVNIPQLLWKYSTVVLSPRRLHWAKRSSTQCRLFLFSFFFGKTVLMQEKNKQGLWTIKDFIWSVRRAFVLSICFTIGVLVFSF